MRDPLEQYVIDAIRQRRINLKISQLKLAYALGYESVAYIGAIESMHPERTESYNIKQINAISKLLQCSSHEFFPTVYPFSYVSERKYKAKKNKKIEK